jgi:molecular chaperone GrpE (heat shock protein)
MEIVEGQVDNKIVEVVEKGYRMADQILRPARVKVAKKQTEPLK